MTDRNKKEPALGLHDAKREEKAREFGITVEELDGLGYRELDQLDDRKVIVTDIQMPFGSMVVFMVKRSHWRDIRSHQVDNTQVDRA